MDKEEYLKLNVPVSNLKLYFTSDELNQYNINRRFVYQSNKKDRYFITEDGFEKIDKKTLKNMNKYNYLHLDNMSKSDLAYAKGIYLELSKSSKVCQFFEKLYKEKILNYEENKTLSVNLKDLLEMQKEFKDAYDSTHEWIVNHRNNIAENKNKQEKMNDEIEKFL